MRRGTRLLIALGVVVLGVFGGMVLSLTLFDNVAPIVWWVLGLVIAVGVVFWPGISRFVDRSTR